MVEGGATNSERALRSPDFIRDRAKDLRRKMTQPERTLWALLRRNELGWHFRRQHPVGPYILDFYCAVAKLAIEVDGPVHAERAEQDARRAAWLAKEGIKVVRFSTEEVEGRPAAVLTAIARAAPPLHRLTAVPLPRKRERLPD